MGIRNVLYFLKKNFANALQAPQQQQFVDKILTMDGTHFLHKYLNESVTCTTSDLFDSDCTCTMASNLSHDQAEQVGNIFADLAAHEVTVLRKVFVLCMFCYRHLMCKNLIFVLDGVAPHIKMKQLQERQLQRQRLQRKTLNQKRVVLLSYLIQLRLCQISCILQALILCAQTSRCTLDKLHDDVQVCFDHPLHIALCQSLQCGMEWALGSEIENDLFQTIYRNVLVSENAFSVLLLEMALQFFTHCRFSVQTSFVIEIDVYTNQKIHILFTLASHLKQPQNAPFVFCVHMLSSEAICAFKNNVHDNLVHLDKPTGVQFIFVSHVDADNEAEIVFPFAYDNSAVNEQLYTFWCTDRNTDCNFASPSQLTTTRKMCQIFKAIDYEQWFCNAHSKAWLQGTLAQQTHVFDNNVVATSGSDQTNAQFHTHPNKMFFHFADKIPKRFGQTYDTVQDPSHFNVTWCLRSRAQFVALLPTNGVTYVRTNNLACQSTKSAHVVATDIYAQFYNRDVTKERTVVGESKKNNNKRKRKEVSKSVGGVNFNSEPKKLSDEFMQLTVHFLRNICNCQVIVAQHEAEATCAQLCRNGFADFVLSNDLDALAFGSPNCVLQFPSTKTMLRAIMSKESETWPVYRNLKHTLIIQTDELLQQMELDHLQFVIWLVMCGSDFLVDPLYTKCVKVGARRWLQQIVSLSLTQAKNNCEGSNFGGSDIRLLLTQLLEDGEKYKTHKSFHVKWTLNEKNAIVETLQFFLHNVDCELSLFEQEQLQGTLDVTQQLPMICASRKNAASM